MVAQLLIIMGPLHIFEISQPKNKLEYYFLVCLIYMQRLNDRQLFDK